MMLLGPSFATNGQNIIYDSGSNFKVVLSIISIVLSIYLNNNNKIFRTRIDSLLDIFIVLQQSTDKNIHGILSP